MGRKFSQAKLDTFKEFFIDRRKQIIENLNKSAEDIELDIDGDDVDITQGKILSEQASLLNRREVQTLNKINASIKKIDEGTFGQCEECDGRIGEKRLKAIPGCDLCIECAEEREKYNKQFGEVG